MYINRYIVVGGFVGLVLIVAVLLLVNCRGPVGAAAEGSLTPEAPKAMPQKFEYATVTAKCESDHSRAIICHKVEENDYTDVNNIIADKAREGWQLIEVAQVGDLTSFIFERDK